MRRRGYHRKTRRRARPGVRRVLLAGVLPGLVVLAAGAWLASTTWYPAHVERATGRTDLGWVSCLNCHGRTSAPPVQPVADTERYASPTGVAVSRDGSRLFVVASGTGRLLEIDLASGSVERSVEIGGRPHAVALSPDGTRLAVTRRDVDEVVLLDARGLAPVGTYATGAEPIGATFSPDGSRLWVANGFSDDVSVLPVAGDEEPRRVVAGNEPYAIAAAANGALVGVANRIARPVQPGEMPISELTFVAGDTGRVTGRRELVSAHLSEGIALASDASFALAAAVRIRNLLPLTQVSRGGVMNTVIAYADLTADGGVVQLPLDEVNAYYADPASVVMTPDDRLAFVAHAGARAVTAIDVAALRALVDCTPPDELEAMADRLDLAEQYVAARIPTLHNPQAMAIDPAGARLYVAERLSDTIAVVDVERLEVVDRIELGEPVELSARRHGEIVFTDAAGTFQGQFSCRSCHPDGHTDSLIWDFVIDGVGSNLVETRSLRGIRQTAPFKWNGKNPDLATQCGPRFAMVLTRTDPFAPEDLADLVTFIESIPRSPHRQPEALAEARERGRELFFRDVTAAGETIPVANRCPTCHRPPLFTDRLMADVATGGLFDTPHLFDIASSPPYLHDGRALTLEEIWTVHSLQDEHGVTGDLTKVQLNDLMVYLRSL
jgi:YVTN family beta-propeller protein